MNENRLINYDRSIDSFHCEIIQKKLKITCIFSIFHFSEKILGFENLDSGVGLYAPDAESYTLFKELFDPVIDDYHKGFKPTDKHPPTDFGDVNTLCNVDPDNQFVISTRVRCGRSLQGYPFNPCLTEAVSFDFF